jgi:hypothetical protein
MLKSLQNLQKKFNETVLCSNHYKIFQKEFKETVLCMAKCDLCSKEPKNRKFG